MGLGVGLHDVLYQPLVRLTRPPSEADQRLGAPGENTTVKQAELKRKIAICHLEMDADVWGCSQHSAGILPLDRNLAISATSSGVREAGSPSTEG